MRAALVLVLSLAACLSDRVRPAPPRLTITLSRTTVHSPDTLTGTLRAEDADGIDSVWLSWDYRPPVAENGLLMPVYTSPFRAPIPPGYPPGTKIPVVFSARDLEGFRASLDTLVTVGP